MMIVERTNTKIPNKNIMDITDELIRCIKEEKPITFAKFGDGEYMCAIGLQGHNCDGTNYSPELAQGLKTSIKIINTFGGYIGLWDEPHVKQFWEETVGGEVNWAHYHSVIVDRHDWKKKMEIYKAIKESKLNKIYIGNDLMKRVEILLNTKRLTIHPHNWFYYDFHNILHSILLQLNDHCNIILTSGGMASKILISQLMLHSDKNIFIDIGSALDLIATKKDSRGYMPYDEMKHYFHDILPDNWEDEQFNDIYEQAQTQLGLHLHP